MTTPFQGATRRNLLLGAGALTLATPSIARCRFQTERLPGRSW